MEGFEPIDISDPRHPYTYNGKEEVLMGVLDYGARLYDPYVGRFASVDRFADKYAFQSPYAYAANSPFRFIDVNGDSIWVSIISGGGKNGNDLIQINVTGTVIDNTSGGLTQKQIERKRKQIIKGIEKSFKGSGEGIEYEASVQISISSSRSSVKPSDHVFRLVDDVAKTRGLTATPGRAIKGEALPFENVVYLV